MSILPNNEVGEGASSCLQVKNVCLIHKHLVFMPQFSLHMFVEELCPFMILYAFILQIAHKI